MFNYYYKYRVFIRRTILVLHKNTSYIEWVFVTATDIATIIASYTGVAVVVGGVSWKLFRRAVDQAIEANKISQEPMNELRHNGGSSMLDVVKLQMLPMLTEVVADVKELRENQIVISNTVSKLEGRFEQHVEEGE